MNNKYIKLALVTALVVSATFAVSVLRGVHGDTLDCSSPQSFLTAHILSNGAAGGGALAIVSNNSDCQVNVGLDAFLTSDNSLFDSQGSGLPARQTVELHISVPDCQYRLELSSGSTILETQTVRSNVCGGGVSTPTPTPGSTPAPTVAPTPTPAAPTPTPVPGNRPPAGVFDAANCDIIGGWVYDPDAPTASLTVSIYRDGPPGIGTLIATTSTTGFRPDANAAVGITGNHGFTVSTPASLKDGATHEIWVVARDVNTGVDTLFENRKFLNTASCVAATPTPAPTAAPTPTPAAPTPTPVPGNRPPAGELDAANCDIIGGWAYDPDTSSDQIRVSVYADGPVGTGTLIAVLPTDGLRPDANAVMGISGRHGYMTNTPASLRNTSTHTIYAYALDSTTGTGFQVSGSPRTFGPCVAPTTPTPTPTPVITPTPTPVVTPTPAAPTPTPTPVNQCNVGTVVVNSSNSAPYSVIGPMGALTVTGNNVFTNQAVGSYTISPSGNNNIIVSPTTNILACNSTIIFNITVNNPAAPTPTPTPVITPYPTYTPLPIIYSSLNISKMVRNLSGNSSEVKSVTANQNDTVEFVIRVSAPSNQPANNVRVTDSLPYGLAYIPGSATIDNNYLGDGITSGGVNLGSFYPGRLATIRFRATVSQTYYNYSQYNQYGTYGNPSYGSTTLTNTASAIADNTSTVSDSATVFVTATNPIISPNTLSIQKTGRNITRGDNAPQTSLTARPGDGIEFTLTVTAPTNTNLSNVVVSDVLPAGLNYTSGSTTLNNNRINDGIVSGGLNIGTIYAGQSAKIVFYATVNSGLGYNQVLTNTATGRADNTSPVTSNPVQITITNNTVLQAALHVRTGPAGTAFAISGFGALMTSALYAGRRKVLGSLINFT